MWVSITTTIIIAVFSGSAATLATASASSSSWTTTAPSYVSVRALDEYGNAEQLQNALKAANLQGTLVVAARDSIHNTTIVLSLLEEEDPATATAIIDSNTKTTSPTTKKSMLQLINNNPAFLGGNNKKHSVAIVCTGLRGDANWLVSTIRAYSHRVWTRYNTFVDASAVAHALSKYYRSFWGYDEEEEWMPAQLLQDFERDDNNGLPWGRPLGVVSIVLSSSLPFLLVIEPSGIIQSFKAFAMGKYSSEILEKFADVAVVVNDGNHDDDEGDLKDRLVSLIRSVVPSAKRDTSILVETLSESGIERTIVAPCK